MATARQQPSNKPAAPAHADSTARWPILARIAEVRRDDEAPARAPVSNEPTYRLDAPHVDVPAPPLPAPKPANKPAVRPTPRSSEPQSAPAIVATPIAPSTNIPSDKRDDHFTRPVPVRPAKPASKDAQPHQELIRFAAMLALMVVAGMAAVLMMRDRFRPTENTSTPVAATSNQSGNTEPATQHAEFEPTLEPQLAPETDTSSLEPTATGPLAPPSNPVMAIESPAAPAALPYPTTSFAEFTLPPVEASKLPQVQTSEAEVARVQETTNETKVR